MVFALKEATMSDLGTHDTPHYDGLIRLCNNKKIAETGDLQTLTNTIVSIFIVKKFVSIFNQIISIIAMIITIIS